MSKTLLDYAVKFNQIEGTVAASTAFLHQLGFIAHPLITPPAATIDVPAGTTEAPAVVSFVGVLNATDSVDVELSNTVPDTLPVNVTATETMNAAEVAEAVAAVINASAFDAVAEAVGNTVEILATAPATDVTIDSAAITVNGTFEPSIIEVVDPEQLQYWTHAYVSAQGAFDGGLTRLYLILIDDAADLPALLLDKECDFYTVVGGNEFTGDDYETNLAGWQGVRCWTTIEQADGKLWAALNATCIFFEDVETEGDESSYFSTFSFGNLLSGANWRNQQYIPTTGAGHPVQELGLADSLFDDRISFYLTDDEQGTRLAFFVAGGKSITTPYINRELQVVMQSDMLNFLAANQPMNIETNRRLLEQVGQGVIDTYLDNALLDPVGENSITITESAEAFIVNGNMTTTEAEALWRVEIDAINVLGV